MLALPIGPHAPTVVQALERAIAQPAIRQPGGAMRTAIDEAAVLTASPPEQDVVLADNRNAMRLVVAQIDDEGDREPVLSVRRSRRCWAACDPGSVPSRNSLNL